ncbi:1-acyl-sn-glycerol-3-phosphate acyltransferase [Cohaesibacter marisflavi]|uniref:1-acyl-sn-glycerol-3-phosphate acyltransferase n=1 Tax=Cohaesibacter marisflavi TaxID=655353 RepID=A0A1I5IM76_9HYPH|nr:1-acyl-sn-glycerol-3-phosphate acyltransferase [Cohaesibacter marisflavi]SFO61583.1 1-acyl-sn-glycerol-3-phosphate acyltransferase [Cohaesibacter marisflavi]
MLIIRSVLFNAAFYLSTALMLIISIFTYPLPRRYLIKLAGIWAKVCAWLFTTIVGGSYEVRGAEKIPKGQSIILASKHMSAFETFALVPLVDDPLFILKRELLRYPLFGWALLKTDMIPIDRSAGLKALRGMLLEARKKMTADSRQLIIFPEGTRRRPDTEPVYKFGISHIYHALEVPCYPVALNTGLFWPKGSPIRHSGKIIIEILPPIEPGMGMRPFFEQLSETIESHSNRLISEARAANKDLPPPTKTEA